MSKNTPIGVRFDPEILQELNDLGCKTPQQALRFLEKFYRSNKLIVAAVAHRLLEPIGTSEDVRQNPMTPDEAHKKGGKPRKTWIMGPVSALQDQDSVEKLYEVATKENPIPETYNEFIKAAKNGLWSDLFEYSHAFLKLTAAQKAMIRSKITTK